MRRDSSAAHTHAQVVRELMGRANYMSHDVRYAKRANQREKGRLLDAIEGKNGINSQSRFRQKQTNQEIKNTRRDLAHTLYKRKQVSYRHFPRCGSIISTSTRSDPEELMVLAKERKREIRRTELLMRSQARLQRTEERMKHFMQQVRKDIQRDNGLVPNIEPDVPSVTLTQEEDHRAQTDIDENIMNLYPDDEPIFAPDGKLRAKLRLPSIESSWEEAKRTRYIRTRILREFERELTFKEIFNWDVLPPI